MKNAQTTKAAANVKTAAKTAPKAKADPMAAMVASAATVEKIKADDKKAAETAKKPRTVRAAQKPVAKKESAVVATVKAVPVKYVITGGARPIAGRHLFAHTEALFQLAGMYEGGAVDRAHLADVIGASAIAYHTKKENFVTTAKGIELTAQGRNFFKARGLDNAYDPKDVEAFKEMLSTGAMDGRLVKNQEFIRAIKA